MNDNYVSINNDKNMSLEEVHLTRTSLFVDTFRRHTILDIDLRVQEDIHAVVQEQRVYFFGVLQHANVRGVQHDNVQIGLATDTRINGCGSRNGIEIDLIGVRVCRGVITIAVIVRVVCDLIRHILFCVIFSHR